MHPFIVTAGDLHECADHTNDRSQQTRHRCNSSDIIKVANTVGEDTCLARAFCLGDLSDFLKSRTCIFRHEIECLLGNASNTLILFVTMCHQT